MSAPGQELQKAIFVRLTGDSALVSLLGGARVYDLAPASAAFPYITFGRVSQYDWSTGTEKGFEEFFTVHVWSKGKGKAEIHAILDRVQILLDDGLLVLETHHLVSLGVEFSEARYDEDIATHHGSLRLRALLERAA